MGAAVELHSQQSIAVRFRSPAGELLDVALERARYEYTELADNWKQLDSKAQATAAIAGVFLAASFAGRIWSIEQQVLAATLALSLIAAIGCSVLAMRVAGFEMPPSGKWALTWVDAKLRLGLSDDQLREAKRLLHREFLVHVFARMLP